ncbi:MAG: glycerate kinase [Steroidobacteraceae bacterium]
MTAIPTGLAPREFLRRLYGVAVDAADPAQCIPPALPPRPRGRAIVVGAGKAAAAMAAAVEGHWDGPLEGTVVTVPGAEVDCDRIEVRVAGHPLPAAEGVDAARSILERVRGLGPDDLVIVLLSGGGSALMPLPADGLALDDKQRVTRSLLLAGATIREINCVRRHLSRIKGGRLAVACAPARVVTLAISDVPGDDPVDLASGPTVADPTTCADALEVLARHGIALPAPARAALESGRWESVKPGDPAVAAVDYRLVATPAHSLEAARAWARSQGVEAEVVSDRLEGESRVVGAAMARLAAARVPRPGAPHLLISGGETTVTVRGPGRGGPNVEFLLAFGLSLPADRAVHAIACDTDGVDGNAPVAGAIWTPGTVSRAAALGLDPVRHLESNDAHSFFEALGDSVVTGPTRTNVNDFRAILLG